jgi:hypothetical protein
MRAGLDVTTPLCATPAAILPPVRAICCAIDIVTYESWVF